MLASLKMLREQYGSVESYVTTQCGLTDAQVQKLIDNMTTAV